MSILGDVGDSKLFQLASRLSRNVAAKEINAAFACGHQTGDGFDQLCLAIALDTGDADDLARTHVERNSIERSTVLSTDVKIFDFEIRAIILSIKGIGYGSLAVNSLSFR